MILYRTGIMLLSFVLDVNCEKNAQIGGNNIRNDTRTLVDANMDRVIDFYYKELENYDFTFKPKIPNFTLHKLGASDRKCLDYISNTINEQYEYYKKKPCLQEIIVGGRSACSGEFPHMAALGWRSAIESSEWLFKCGATLISHKFVVTAGHCTYIPSSDETVADRQPEIVKLGDTSLIDSTSDGGEPTYIKISEIIPHPDYDPPERYNDIALMELEESVQFGAFIRPACLWSSMKTSSLGEPSVCGWGVVDPASCETTTELQVTEVSFINNEECDELLESLYNRNWEGLAEHQICAGYLPGGSDTCQGDSGGPLQCQINLKKIWPMYYLVGVTSFGYHCGLPDKPSVYTRIACFVDWIEGIVWPSS